MRYSPERKEAVLEKMMPPHNRTIKQLALEEGISEATLYNWRQEARSKGILFFPHAIRQMARPDRMITTAEIRTAIEGGEIIEDYANDVWGHSCLIFS